MKLESADLQDALMGLSGRDREALEAHIRGQASAAGLQILQTVKSRLKRKARAGKPRKIRLNKNGEPRKSHRTGRAPGQGVNSTALRNAKIAAATKAEETAARRDYEVYKERLAKIHAPVEAWALWFAEWLDVKQAEAIEGARAAAGELGLEGYEARDYGAIYRAGDRWSS